MTEFYTNAFHCGWHFFGTALLLGIVTQGVAQLGTAVLQVLARR